MKKYIAYGSNLNLEQMARRCPTAKVIGIGFIKDYKLTFRGVATIEKCVGSEVPIGVWEIDEICEKSLDIYEGYPRLYRKEEIEITLKGKQEIGMVYIMNEGKPALPNTQYYNAIRDGYLDVGLDITYLEEALKDTYNRIKQNKE